MKGSKPGAKHPRPGAKHGAKGAKHHLKPRPRQNDDDSAPDILMDPNIPIKV